MRYYKKIDGLRFVAIFFVLLDHFAGKIAHPISAGYYGVDLFFVISGFLITSILLKYKDNSIRSNYYKFLGRRMLRIFPIYYLTIFLLWIIGLPVVRDYLIWFLTYTFNYAWPLFKISDTPANHFWSLAVEEQFYLMWPFVVFVLKDRIKVFFMLVILIITFGYIIMAFDFSYFLSKFRLVGLHTRMASLSFGALISLLHLKKMIKPKIFESRWIEYAMLVLLVFSLLMFDPLKPSMQPFLLGLCSFYIVIKAAYYKFNISIIEKFLSNDSIVKVGTLAYGIYVFHFPMGYYLDMCFFNDFFATLSVAVLKENEWILRFPMYFAISIILASLSFKFIENPILSLKDKFFKY